MSIIRCLTTLLMLYTRQRLTTNGVFKTILRYEIELLNDTRWSARFLAIRKNLLNLANTDDLTVKIDERLLFKQKFKCFQT